MANLESRVDVGLFVEFLSASMVSKSPSLSTLGERARGEAVPMPDED